MAAITDPTLLTNYVNQYRLPGLKKQVGNLSLFLKRLMANEKPTGGGAINFTARVKFQNRTQGGGIGYVTEAKMVDTVVTPEVPHVHIIEPFHISKTKLEEIAASNNKVAFVSYMDEVVGNAEESLKNFLSRSVYSSGGIEASAEGRQIPHLTGLGAISARDTAYAGITQAVAPTWNPQHVALDGAANSAEWSGIAVTGTAPTTDNLLDRTSPYFIGHLLNRGISLGSWEDESPDLILAGDVMYDVIADYLETQKQFVNTATAEGDFESIKWRGRTVTMDKNCPAGEINMVSSKSLDFHAVPKNMISLEPIVPLPGTDWLVGIWKFAGNMVCTSRRHQVRFTGLPTTFV